MIVIKISRRKLATRQPPRCDLRAIFRRRARIPDNLASCAQEDHNRTGYTIWAVTEVARVPSKLQDKLRSKIFKSISIRHRRSQQSPFNLTAN